MTYKLDNHVLNNELDTIENNISQPDGFAHFVRKPSNISEVEEITANYKGTSNKKGVPYYVFDTIELDGPNYTDFINEYLLVDHPIVANIAERCGVNQHGIWKCLRVVNCDKPTQRILIQSEGYHYARYVAIEQISPELLMHHQNEAIKEIAAKLDPNAFNQTKITRQHHER